MENDLFQLNVSYNSFDENDHIFLTIGFGKAIISYIFRVLIDVLYKNVEIYKSIESPNYIKINGNIFLEDEILQEKIIEIETQI